MKRMLLILYTLLLIEGNIACAQDKEIAQKNKMVITNTQSRPKNVIFMIGDGMGVGQLEIARLFEFGKEGRLFMESLPNTAFVQTYSLNNFVTDSAAAGTALATGQKTNNEMIGVKPNGKELNSILDQFQKAGKKVGVITTSSVTDATPAAFTASVVDRWSGQEDIARQQLANRIDVLLGGGSKHFVNQNGEDLQADFEKNGYSIVHNRSELKKIQGTKLLGLFNEGHMNFKLDRDDLNSNEPDLTEMTKKAIEVLDQDKNGFFVMIEGARIDHASHAADITSIWRETIEFDQAVQYAVNWAKSKGDTLVIVVADHETMGVSATEPLNIDNLKSLQVSTSYMSQKLHWSKQDSQNNYEKLKYIFQQYANINLSNDELKDFIHHLQNQKGEVYKQSRIAWEIGSIIAAHNKAGVVSSDIRINSSTGGHTGNPVPLFSYGKGSECFKGVLNNNDIPKIIANLMGYPL